MLFAFDKTYDGIWKTIGYGLVLDIRKGRVTTYQVSGSRLVPYKVLNGRIKSNKMKTSMITLNLELMDNHLTALNIMGIQMFKAEKLTSYHGYKIVEATYDPKTNYDIFWQTFEENYPFFDLYCVDWREVKMEMSAHLEENMSEGEFFQVLSESVKALNDDHVYVAWGDTDFTPYKDLPKWHKDKQSRPLVKVIEKTYFGDFVYSPDRYIRHGRLDNLTGYILIATMAGYENENKAVKRVSAAFRQALEDLRDTERIVLDLRFNRGGFDTVGLALAGYFTQSTQPAYRKAVKTPNGYAEEVTVLINPRDVSYADKSIVILTSKATVSAAETFVLAMKTLPNVKTIGEPTAGFYSDMMERQLPNGMTYGLPHILYYSTSGELMESNGMLPDVEIPIDLSAMTQEKDPALDWLKAH